MPDTASPKKIKKMGLLHDAKETPSESSKDKIKLKRKRKRNTVISSLSSQESSSPDRKRRKRNPLNGANKSTGAKIEPNRKRTSETSTTLHSPLQAPNLLSQYPNILDINELRSISDNGNS